MIEATARTQLAADSRWLNEATVIVHRFENVFDRKENSTSIDTTDSNGRTMAAYKLLI
jgi:hypothetical protein